MRTRKIKVLGFCAGQGLCQPTQQYLDQFGPSLFEGIWWDFTRMVLRIVFGMGDSASSWVWRMLTKLGGKTIFAFEKMILLL